jgi:protein involved in polysaccharide export with SLBB domain
MLSMFVGAALFVCIVGCGSIGAAVTAGTTASSFTGGFTLFPANNYLMKDTKNVTRGIPRSASVPRELQKTVISPYIIQPADGLTLEPITTKPAIKLSGEQTVMPDGSIDLGKYGRLVVAGQALEQIEAEVDAAVEAVEDHPVRVNVRLSKPVSAVYYVLGEVNAPGAYPLTGRETVLDAIAAAKGLTTRASPCRMLLTRPTQPQSCRVVIPICYRQIVQLGDTSTNYQLMPGDRVFVASQSIWEQLLPCARRGCKQCRGVQCPCPQPAALDSLPSGPTYALPEDPIVPGSRSQPTAEEVPSKPAR